MGLIDDSILALRETVHAARRRALSARQVLPSWRLTETPERYTPASEHAGLAGAVSFAARTKSRAYTPPARRYVAVGTSPTP